MRISCETLGSAYIEQRGLPCESMERERTFVRRLVQMDVYGGRVIERDMTTLILMDVPSWGDAQSHKVRVAFPLCTVSYAVSSTSLSGFVVIIRRHERGLSLWWLLLLCAVGGALLYAFLGAHGWEPKDMLRGRGVGGVI